MKVIICGANGKMGQTVASYASLRKEIQVVAGVDVFFDAHQNPFPVFSNIADCDVDADLIIDFSRPAALRANLAYAKEKKLRVVIATTGYSPEEREIIRVAAEEIPVFFCANMSLGLNVQLDLCRLAAQAFGRDADIEIVEMHHHRKVDAPSGTALALADAINESFGNTLDYEYDRHSKTERRTDHEIGLHSIRGGNIVGDHQVLFIADNEILEITHRVQDRGVFAVGALHAAEYLMNKPIGLYSMQDLLSEVRLVTGYTARDHEAVVTLRGVPHDTRQTAQVFKTIADAKINIDIISQVFPRDGSIDLSFSLPEADADRAQKALRAFAGAKIALKTGLTKIIVEGIGMESNPGVAAKLFEALARNDVELEIITTSETKISFCVPREKRDAALLSLKESFGLKI